MLATDYLQHGVFQLEHRSRGWRQLCCRFTLDLAVLCPVASVNLCRGPHLESGLQVRGTQAEENLGWEDSIVHVEYVPLIFVQSVLASLGPMGYISYSSGRIMG